MSLCMHMRAWQERSVSLSGDAVLSGNDGLMWRRYRSAPAMQVEASLNASRQSRRASSELGRCILRTSEGRRPLTEDRLKRVLAVDGLSFDDARKMYVVYNLRKDIEEEWLTVHEPLLPTQPVDRCTHAHARITCACVGVCVRARMRVPVCVCSHAPLHTS